MDLELIEKFAAVVGPQGLVTDPSEQLPYCTDWLGKWQGECSLVVRPTTTEQVAGIVRLCHAHGIPIIPQGGNTGMSGGATPDSSGSQVIISLTRMRNIRQVDSVNDTLTVDAGVLLAEVQQAAAAADRYFPLSLGAEGSCSIGGNLASNAGGTAVLRYGNTRELTLGLEVVLPDGRIWNGLRGLRKDNTGYDLRDLFIGSEGTLGIITGAVLKLYPRPAGRATAWIGCESTEQLTRLLALLRSRCGERLVACEMLSDACMQLITSHVDGARHPLAQPYPYNGLIELADTQPSHLEEILANALGEALEAGLISDATIASNQTQAADFWRLREGISQAQVRAGKAIKHDIALPISSLAPFIELTDALILEQAPDLVLINFGHLGDGNLHYNVLVPKAVSAERYAEETRRLNRLVHDQVARFGGSISAEHGVGQLRRDELKHYKDPLELELMLRIKQALDPNQLMNPGKLL
jgi:FAD/FMN-containing dehydrogenase